MGMTQAGGLTHHAVRAALKAVLSLEEGDELGYYAGGSSSFG